MPRKNTMRDNVTAVRSRLPHLTDLTRDKIELALLYYESNVDETVEAFKQNGAIEALGGWTEMHNHRGHTSTKRTNNKPLTLATNSSSQIPSSSGILRPSQRVSNLFQTFAEGSTPVTTPNGSEVPILSSPSSSFIEQSDNNNLNLNSSTTNNEKSERPKSQRRRSSRTSRNSITQNHETMNNQQPAVRKSSSSNPVTFTNNKKTLTKSVKDLQRQTSTLTNVELLFNNEIKSSIKRIDDIFKQLREIVKEREVELYLQMDKVKEQGLNIIHRRQQRAVELRQHIDRCDRLTSSEIDNLRMDIKQFVTDRRYDLGEELTSSHRFEYDQTLIESLKNFGHVLTVDRKRSISTSSALVEANTSITEKSIPNTTPIPTTNGRTSSSSSDETVFINKQQSSPQRTNNNKSLNNQVLNSPINDNTGDYQQNYYYIPQTNGYLPYYDDTNNYQNVNRRRPQQYSQGNFQRSHPALNYYNGNNRNNVTKQTNGRVNPYNNSKTLTTNQRPPPSQSIVPV